MSPLQHVHVTHDFASTPDEVFDLLSEHENLGPLFGAKVTRVRDGDIERNGAGSVRRIVIKVLPGFEETVTTSERPRLIEYEITKGSPLTGHRGVMRFEPTESGGTHVDYQIWFGSKIPGAAAVVQKTLTASISKEMPRLID